MNAEKGITPSKGSVAIPYQHETSTNNDENVALLSAKGEGSDHVNVELTASDRITVDLTARDCIIANSEGNMDKDDDGMRKHVGRCVTQGPHEEGKEKEKEKEERRKIFLQNDCYDE